jgi:meso-butanediol dehydrogenase / (S,S)-butanediol dehydrogenase / diacetyl reductase
MFIATVMPVRRARAPTFRYFLPFRAFSGTIARHTSHDQYFECDFARGDNDTLGERKNIGGRVLAGILDGKVALISGTGGGQGRAAALIFAREGAIVYGCDRNITKSQETLELVTAAGGHMRLIAPADLTQQGTAEEWAQAAIDEFGKIDILYNNAASLQGRGSFADTTLEDWEACLKLELTLVFLSTKAVWKHMVRDGGGVIINTASMSGHIETSPIRAPVHGVCKAGIHAFTRMLAAEGAEAGIRAVSISPGLVRTPVTEGLFSGDDARRAIGAEIIRKTPAGRAATSEEIAEVAAFLASNKAAYINGTDVRIDGGFTGVSFG